LGLTDFWNSPVFAVPRGLYFGALDGVALAEDVVTLDGHGVATNGRKLLGDAGDVLQGLSSLGGFTGTVPGLYTGSAFGKLSDSPILSAAQLAIYAERATTGFDDPVDGTGYRESADRLESAVDEELIYTNAAEDRWDGAAATAYNATNKSHKDLVSKVQVADDALAGILDTEAGQVSRTRQTLDETSQTLYDYGLATAWMNAVPGLNVAKQVADAAAAAAALATTNTTMMVLVKNAAENALRVKEYIGHYEDAAKDTSGDGGVCGTFVDPQIDTADTTRPGRLDPNAEFTPPEPLEPPVWGPPATPYGSDPPGR